MQNNNSQSVLPVSLYLHSMAWVLFLSTRQVDQLRRQLAHKDLLQVIMCIARNRCISQGNQLGFEKIEVSEYKIIMQ